MDIRFDAPTNRLHECNDIAPSVRGEPLTIHSGSFRASSHRFGSVTHQFVDPRSFTVTGNAGGFRTDAFHTYFNPTNSTPPFFQIFHASFLSVLGNTPSIRKIASKPGFAFAHEAPIWVPSTDEMFFSSNGGGPLGFSDWNNNNEVGKISIRDVDAAIIASGSSTSAVNVSVTKVRDQVNLRSTRDDLDNRQLDLPDTVQMTNGGTGPFRGSLLLINSGRAHLRPSLTLVYPDAPHNATVLLDNFYGRQFNSLNDVKVHPRSGKIFFTDVT